MTNNTNLTIECFANARKIATITFEQVCMGAQIVHKLTVDGKELYNSTGASDSYVNEITPDFVKNQYANYLESLAEEFHTIECEIA